MADRFYSGVLGVNMPGGVVETGTSTPGSPFEFRVTYDAVGVQKIDALKFLEAAIGAILAETWPPV